MSGIDDQGPNEMEFDRIKFGNVTNMLFSDVLLKQHSESPLMLPDIFSDIILST